MPNITSIGMWLGFFVFLLIALSLDTIVLRKKFARPYESLRASLVWTAIWIMSAFVFNLFLWCYLYATFDIVIANQKALEFLAGYLVEKSLSVDNLFVFYMVFNQFQIPTTYQQRIFSIGIWSAIILRLLLILLGVWLVTEFHWFFYVMGIFLILIGIKMCFAGEEKKDLADSVIIKLLKRFFHVTTQIRGPEFFIKKNQGYFITPLFLALVFIEFSDLIFALDSIPAILGVTTDPFLVWSSNVFAILGLRALYFVLAGMIDRMQLLKYGVALILVFVGLKMLLESWIPISVFLSLTVIISILAIFSVMSLMQRQSKGKR